MPFTNAQSITAADNDLALYIAVAEDVFNARRVLIAEMLLALVFFSLVSTATSSKHSLDLDFINGVSASWEDVYRNYIIQRRPVKIQNAYNNNKAYKRWSLDYIRNHPGAALTFRNLTTKTTASIRTIVEQREYFMQLQFRLPLFLRSDAKLPKLLDCDQLVDRMNTPIWLWHFHETQVKLHNEKSHEFWCMVKGIIQMTMLPEWTDGMIDHFVTEKILAEAPTYRETRFYKAEMKRGDCVYVPGGFLRQWEPNANAMAIKFQIADSALTEREQQFGRCRSLGPLRPLDQIRFADDAKQEDGTIEDSLALQRLISYLGLDNCLDSEDLGNALMEDPLMSSPIARDRKRVAKEVFTSLDRDSDGEFCWNDVDSLSFEDAIELSKFVSSSLTVGSESGSETAERKQNDEL